MPLIWTASASDSQAGMIDYRFSAGPAGGALRVVRDFHVNPQFTYAVTTAEGNYVMQVTARNRASGETATSSHPFSIMSRVTGAGAVISATDNPLVALYSAPACPAGSQLLVRYLSPGDAFQTDPQACSANTSVNFLVGGLLPQTTYQMSAVATSFTGPGGPFQSYTTGPIDPTLAFPSVAIEKPAGASAATSQGLILLDYISGSGGPYYMPTAVDLQGRTVWYYAPRGVPQQAYAYFLRPLAGTGGHVLLMLNDPASPLVRGQILREVDLAGNAVRETNATRVSEQLNALGQLGITDFDHDAVVLPNGHTLVLCSQERVFPAGTQESGSAVDILGNAIVDLDEDYQVTWSWSAYDHLDINRAAVLGETCISAPGCPPLTLATIANDWLHGNSLFFVPQDGSILFSMRHQDWIVKIDYANGNGTGDVVWRLGAEGDFTITSSDPYPWFSHQHNAGFDAGGTTILSLFDNGNTRVARNPGVVEHSRGYVLQMDEAARTVQPILLADLGVFSGAVGSAQLLENGNYYFQAGFVPAPPPLNLEGLSFEVTPGAAPVLELQYPSETYRGYRMHSVYSEQTPASSGLPQRVCGKALCPISPCCGARH